MNDPETSNRPPPHPGNDHPVPGSQPPYPYGGPPRETSVTAVLSLVLGILGWISCWLLGSIPAIICGHLGLRETARDPNLEGRGLAIAGLVLGYTLTAISFLAVGVFAIFVFAVVGWDEFVEDFNSTSRETVYPDDPWSAQCLVILPEGHAPEDPIPGAIWLHGYGWNPSELSIFEEDYQQIANDLGIALIGISASTKIEEGSYEWLEDREGDYDHITGVLDVHSDQVTLDWPNVALFGFSQGAKVAGDLAAHYPDKFRGAILMSPGGQQDEDVPEVPETGHLDQCYVCVVGAEEAYGNVKLTEAYARKLEALGAQVILKKYEGVEEHSTPPDYDARLPEWLAKILNPENESRPKEGSEDQGIDGRSGADRQEEEPAFPSL